MIGGAALLACSLLTVVYGQQAGTVTPEVHPPLPIQKCTNSGGCTTLGTKVTLDANWRWLHTTTGYTDCFVGDVWDAAICPDPITCAVNCALDGADYSGTYGISTLANSLTLKFVTGTNVGSRVYLMANDSAYQLFHLKNQEFSFDVDMSNLPCGLNGALYMSTMDADGGSSKYPTNKAGAKFGTGYCDSQCPHDIKFIEGQANLIGFDDGNGQYGACCSEMDIWEANEYAAAFTPHVCSGVGLTRCSGETECGDNDERYSGVCDKDGCDFNSWRMGNQTFLGPGLVVDTKSKFTVVTQFITDDGTSSGTLSEIRRFYVQDGKIIQNSNTNVPNVPIGTSITNNFCEAQKAEFGDPNYFATQGGLAAMGDAFDQGMVLTMSIWDDHAADMLWLDGDYPVDGNPSTPGVSRGPCPPTSGDPTQVEMQSPDASVIFSNIKFGDIGVTYGNPPKSITVSSSSSSTKSSSSPSSAPSVTVSQWGQCGGIGWNGGTLCASPYTCHIMNPYYSQCY